MGNRKNDFQKKKKKQNNKAAWNIFCVEKEF